MDSICQFVSEGMQREGVYTVFFVYEAEFARLKQPFLLSYHSLHLVTRGTATLHVGGREYPLSVGTLFLTYPGVRHTVTGSEDFAYMYISFSGGGAEALLDRFGIVPSSPVFGGFSRLIHHWQESLCRINSVNAPYLTESVLYHTLSFFHPDREESTADGEEAPLDRIIAYLKNRFTDPELSLKRIAALFSYTEKYLSFLFKRETGVNFNAYLTDLRMQHALRCISDGMCSVGEIAHHCGYPDPLYFSKVFKRCYGVTPRAYMRGSLAKNTK